MVGLAYLTILWVSSHETNQYPVFIILSQIISTFNKLIIDDSDNTFVDKAMTMIETLQREDIRNELPINQVFHFLNQIVVSNDELTEPQFMRLFEWIHLNLHYPEPFIVDSILILIANLIPDNDIPDEIISEALDIAFNLLCETNYSGSSIFMCSLIGYNDIDQNFISALSEVVTEKRAQLQEENEPATLTERALLISVMIKMAEKEMFDADLAVQSIFQMGNPVLESISLTIITEFLFNLYESKESSDEFRSHCLAYFSRILATQPRLISDQNLLCALCKLFCEVAKQDSTYSFAQLPNEMIQNMVTNIEKILEEQDDEEETS